MNPYEKELANDKELSSISLGKAMLDNDYTLYESGKVLHYYDRNMWSLNHYDLETVDDLSAAQKKMLLAKATEENKAKVKELLRKVHHER